MTSSSFSYFSPETIEFLSELHVNNTKSWFEAHKHEYTEYVLKPAQSLVSALSSAMLAIDPLLETSPAVGKTISRIYRDTRFSKDKSPYRSQIWIAFKRHRKERADAPAFFFELTPVSYRYGMGFYSATKETMDSFREMIDDDHDTFRKIVSLYKEQRKFVVEGDQYKRRLLPDTPDDLLAWYQRKNLYLVYNSGIDRRLFGDELVQDLAEGFDQLKDLYRYLYKAKRMEPSTKEVWR